LAAASLRDDLPQTTSSAAFWCFVYSICCSRMPELNQARGHHHNTSSSSSKAAAAQPSATINTAPQRQQQQQVTQLRRAAARPINVLVMHKLPWQVVSPRNCSIDGIPLDCRFSQQLSQVSNII
jgi:hypothetical protein